MGKRSNENAQQRKEDWEASDETNEKKEPQGTFARASEEEMSRRTIRRASDQWKSLTPSSSSTPSTSSNPFASVRLTTSAPTSSNSFVNVTLQLPPAAPPPACRLQELNQAFHAHMKDLRKNKMGHDWTGAMQEYKEYYRAVTNTTAPPVSTTPFPAAPVAAATITAVTATPLAAPVATPVAAAASTFAAPATVTVNSPGSPQSLETVQANPDSGWTKFHTVAKAKCHRFQNASWRSSTGPLSLEFEGNSKVLVIRDEKTGKVVFNVALPADIKYGELKNAKGIPFKTIQFLTKEKADEEPFTVHLQMRMEHMESLYNAITELAAKK